MTGPAPTTREPLRFLLTIDTEISMGGAAAHVGMAPIGAPQRIWGETPAGRFGITCFMDLLEARGMKGVFFFDTEGRHVVNDASLAAAARACADRGHEVALHIHPEFKVDLAALQAGHAVAGNNRLSRHPYETQRTYIREGIATIERWTGRRPVAFRAGSFGADASTLRALAAEGLSIDSSYNAWGVATGMSGFSELPTLNDIAVIGDVVEVPVTNLRARGPHGGMRPFELSSLSAAEMIHTLDALYDAGVRVCCGITHSFRLVRTRDVRYGRVVVDRVNIRRVEAVLNHLAHHRDRFQVCTFADLPLSSWRPQLTASPPPVFPSPPLLTSIARVAVQAIKDRGVI